MTFGKVLTAGDSFIPAGYEIKFGNLLTKTVNSGQSNIKLSTDEKIIPLICNVSSRTNCANWAYALTIKVGTGSNQRTAITFFGDGGGSGGGSLNISNFILYLEKKIDITKAKDAGIISIDSSAAYSSVNFNVVCWLQKK